MEGAVLPEPKHYRIFILSLIFALAGMVAAHGQVTRVPLPNSNFPISQGVWVGNTLYLSGMLDTFVMHGTPGDTETQTVHVLQAIQKALEAQHLTLGDVVLMHAYLAGDPKKDGKMDFVGFMAGYSQFFGTKEQPNKPARSAMQVAALAAPGSLIEIEVVAVKGS